MTSSLDRARSIQPDALDGLRYFESLLQQAHDCKLLGDGDIERLQLECLELLAHQAERYNAGYSSSLRVEAAQGIMVSNLFTISLGLKAHPHPDDAVVALRRESVSDLYGKGRKRIDTMLASAKTIHAKLVRQLVNIPNMFYHATVVDGINGCFKLYNPDFAAHEIHITADYPVFNPVPDLAGIEFIHAYLRCLYYENLFCGLFAADDLHHLLCGFVDQYEEQLLNLYEPVLLAALGCSIVGADVSRLDVTETGAARLRCLLSELSHAETAALVQAAATELTRAFDCSQGLTQYIQASLPQVVANLRLAAREQTLERVFVLPAFPEHKPTISVSYGERMDDGQYRKLVEEIGQCRHTADKVAMITTHIHSLSDLGDLLVDADFTPAQLRDVLCALSFAQIAALAKRHAPMAEPPAFELRESECLLRECLRDVIAGWPQHRQELLAAAVAAMRETP